MLFKLEKKEKSSRNETFYRYGWDGNKVWFTQQDSGDIFAVYVSSDKSLKGLDFFVHIKELETYYPSCVYFNTHHNRFYAENVDEYIENLKIAKILCKEIMEIFESSEHNRL